MSDRDSARDVTVGRAGVPDSDHPPSPDRFIDASSPRIRTGPPSAWRVGVRTLSKPSRPEPVPVPPAASAAPVIPHPPPDVDDAPTGPLPVVRMPAPVRPVPPPTPFVTTPTPAHGWDARDGLDALLVRRSEVKRVGLATRLTRKARNRKQSRQRIDNLERMISAVPLAGSRTIAVVGGKGGIGKTTVAACLGTVFAELRPHDGAVAVDADTAFGKLGSRIDPGANESFQRLLAVPGTTFIDVRNTLGHNVSGLSVCAGGTGALQPPMYRSAVNLLKHHFALLIVDCSTMMDAPVTAEVLRDADAVIVVSSSSGPGAEMAHRTVDWMSTRGLRNLLNRSVVVVNDIDEHAADAGSFGPPILPQATTVAVPFDRELRSGAVIGGSHRLSPPTRLATLEIAAAILDRIGGNALR